MKLPRETWQVVAISFEHPDDGLGILQGYLRIRAYADAAAAATLGCLQPPRVQGVLKHTRWANPAVDLRDEADYARICTLSHGVCAACTTTRHCLEGIHAACQMPSMQGVLSVCTFLCVHAQYSTYNAGYMQKLPIGGYCKPPAESLVVCSDVLRDTAAH